MPKCVEILCIFEINIYLRDHLSKHKNEAPCDPYEVFCSIKHILLNTFQSRLHYRLSVLLLSCQVVPPVEWAQKKQLLFRSKTLLKLEIGNWKSNCFCKNCFQVETFGNGEPRWPRWPRWTQVNPGDRVPAFHRAQYASPWVQLGHAPNAADESAHRACGHSGSGKVRFQLWHFCFLEIVNEKMKNLNRFQDKHIAKCG